MSTESQQQALLNLFASEHVVDLAAIRRALGGKSSMTAFRHLRQLPYRRSYNHNGRYYTRHVPGRYDRSGLWSHGDIHFSVDGTLKDTVRRLVHESEAGATQRELRDRLRVRVHNTLLALVRAEELHRTALAGVYVYLHVEAPVRDEQLARRRDGLAAAARTGASIDDRLIICVLLVLVRRPGSTAVDVVAHLRGHAPPVGLQQVRAVFDRYDLGEKKGGSTS